MSLLRIEGLRYLDRGPIDLAIEGGACVALTGPSGVGKSLMLRAIVDLIPHEGRVWLDGVESQEVPAPLWRRRVGMLPAESLWWFERVGDHFAATDPVRLGRLGFGPDVMAWPVRRLSSGERQRLGLLRLLANEPEVLLLDEPTASLDEENTLRVESLIADYRRERGAVVVWVSHSPAQIARVGERAFRLVAGRLEEIEVR
ncbi:MAG: ATP-binding cassette domain-containing protein [Deltaproteobacteria bacterium]|nr:MAG: ATP-binding cassette domain-containing protein [Deltaproteobacteria bacterium]